MLEVTTQTVGYPGAPGYTTFHFENGTLVDTVAELDGVMAALQLFFKSWSDNAGQGFKANLPVEVRSLNPGTGDLITLLSPTTPPNQVVNQGTSPYAAPAGILIRWNAGSTPGRGHVRGRTFFVPASAAAYNESGGIAPTVQAAVSAKANAFIADCSTAGAPLVVWRRPKGGVGGFASAVISATVAPTVAVLTSRRD